MLKNSGKPDGYLIHHPASLKRVPVQNKGYSKIPVMTADFRTEFDYTFLIYRIFHVIMVYVFEKLSYVFLLGIQLHRRG